jgi:hypothetical protein
VLSKFERHHVIDIYFGMIFQLLSAGSNVDGFSQFIHILSHYLEVEWGQASQEISMEGDGIKRSGVREERYLFTHKACTLLLFLFHIRPTVAGLYEGFAATCGSVQDGAGWILSAMVNSFCDQIRSIGVRVLVVYLERTSQSPDLPLSLEISLALDSEKSKGFDGKSTIQENTRNLISNVGQGFLSTNVGKGLATVRSRLLSPSQLTPRIIYKVS